MDRQVRLQEHALEDKHYEDDLRVAYAIWARAWPGSPERELAWIRYCSLRDTREPTVH